MFNLWFWFFYEYSWRLNFLISNEKLNTIIQLLYIGQLFVRYFKDKGRLHFCLRRWKCLRYNEFRSWPRPTRVSLSVWDILKKILSKSSFGVKMIQLLFKQTRHDQWFFLSLVDFFYHLFSKFSRMFRTLFSKDYMSSFYRKALTANVHSKV